MIGWQVLHFPLATTRPCNLKKATVSQKSADSSLLLTETSAKRLLFFTENTFYLNTLE